MMEHKPESAAGAVNTVHQHHLGDGMALSGLRRAISQVSMLVMKATTSGEVAWREECLKYASHLVMVFPARFKEKPSHAGIDTGLT